MSGPYKFVYPGGVFALENVLVATAATLGFQHGIGRGDPDRAAGAAPDAAGQPRPCRCSGAYRPALAAGCPWLERLADPSGPRGPLLGRRCRFPLGALAPAVPVSLLTGWSDAAWTRSWRVRPAARGPAHPVRLVVGPWTHASGVQPGPPPSSWARHSSWLRAYTADASPPPRSLTKTSRCGSTSAARGNGATWPWPAGLARQPWYLGAGGGLAAHRRRPRMLPGPGCPRSATTRRIHAVGGWPAAYREGGGRGQPGPGGPPRRPGFHQCAAGRGAGRGRPGQRAGPGPRLRPALRPVRPAVRRGPAGAFT